MIQHPATEKLANLFLVVNRVFKAAESPGRPGLAPAPFPDVEGNTHDDAKDPVGIRSPRYCMVTAMNCAGGTIDRHGYDSRGYQLPPAPHRLGHPSRGPRRVP